MALWLTSLQGDRGVNGVHYLGNGETDGGDSKVGAEEIRDGVGLAINGGCGDKVKFQAIVRCENQVVDVSAFRTSECPILWVDNQSVVAIATSPMFHARSKHRSMSYLSSCQFDMCQPYQIVNVLSTDRFMYLTSQLKMSEILFHLREDVNHVLRYVT
uniref:Uncharacterized protein n=1 Tax=Cannabis sativa TaxID=3483 RepID=A0A803P1J3_CANSA